MISRIGTHWPAVLCGARKPLNTALRTRVVSALCAPREVDDYLELLDRTWSLREVRARVLAVHAEAGGATSLWLWPNENWRGFRAGQFVCVSVSIAGVRYTRCFSISSAPEAGLPLRITIRAAPMARVGAWAAHAARPGQVVTLSQALGTFVLPTPAPAKLLFIAGGSGITPFMSMISHLLGTGYAGELVCLHYARREPTFGVELTELSRRHPNFRYVPVPTGGGPSAAGSLRGHFEVEHLTTVVPEWMQCETFVCGPEPLEAAVTRLMHERGAGGRLHIERFQSPAPRPTEEPGARCKIIFAKSDRVVDGQPSWSLLEQAEGAGLRPAYACRMGICQTCRCRKLSGVVRNELTGAVSSEADEEIQLCVSSARTDVVLDL